MIHSAYKSHVLIIGLLICFILNAQEDDFLIEKFKDHKQKVNALAFSKSGNYLASGGEDRLLVIRDLVNTDNSKSFSDNYFPIKDMEFYGDRQLFLSAGRDVKLIDLKNNQLALYKGSATYVWSLDFAPERNKLTIGSFDKTLKIWDVQSEKVILKLHGHEKSALSITFSGDEKYVVSGSRDRTIKVWNAQNGNLMHSYKKHTGNIYDIEFHPDSRYFASASEDKTIRLWDIEQGKVIKTYTGHDGAVLDVDFSPDGYFMYSAGMDGVVYVWDVSTGQKIYSYVLHEGAVNSVAVSNNGQYVATAGDDGLVMLWKSGMYIIVSEKYASELNKDYDSNPIFEDKRKGESKSDFEKRKIRALAEEWKLIEQYFVMYQKEKEYIKIPSNESN